jgi:hypothetical protein
MILSLPFSIAIGWDISNLGIGLMGILYCSEASREGTQGILSTYFSKPTLRSFFLMSILPTNRITFPSASASILSFSISLSYSLRRIRNSSLLLTLSSGFGIRDWTGKLVGDSIGRPERRARIVSFRATSSPLRSSLGSGS